MGYRHRLAALGIAGLLAPLAVFHAFEARVTAPPATPPAESSAMRPPPQSGGPECGDIYKVVCKNRGVTRDPTGSVRPDTYGEIQALRIYQSVIRAHPDWSSEQVDEELVKLVYTPERKERVERAYAWVRGRLEKLIERQPETVFSPAQKRTLVDRVHRTTLDLPPPAANYADEPDLFTKNDVFYERLVDGRTRMRVGGAYLFTAKSWFNIIFTMGHELAHSIDPCEMRFARVDLPAYDQLTSCFKSTGLIPKLEGSQDCEKSDHLAETFADWMAVQVTAEALAERANDFRPSQMLSAVTNSVRDLCEQDDGPDEMDTEFHPTPRVRIEAIFGRNPAIRQVLGCAPTVAPERAVASAGAGAGTSAGAPLAPELGYCNFQSTAALSAVIATTPQPSTSTPKDIHQ